MNTPEQADPAGHDAEVPAKREAATTGNDQPRRGALTTRIRATRQGAAVEAILAEATGFRSAQDLHGELRRRGAAVGLTTVYRHLTNMAEAGTVDMLHTDDGESVYRLCGSELHHHHVVCRQCGDSVEVDGPEVEAWAARVAEQAGYSDVSHTLEVFGTCRRCTAGVHPRDGR